MYCISYGVLLSCIFTILRRYEDIIYAEQSVAVWIGASIFIIIGLLREINEIIVKRRENLNGVNIGGIV